MKTSKKIEKKFYDTKSFKALNAEWNKKLVASGFQDIESDYDKEHGTGRKDHFDVDPVRMLYHQKCEAYLAMAVFQDQIDRVIFEKHSQGISNRDIELFLAVSETPLDRRTIDRRLLKMLKVAGIEPITFSY